MDGLVNGVAPVLWFCVLQFLQKEYFTEPPKELNNSLKPEFIQVECKCDDQQIRTESRSIDTNLFVFTAVLQFITLLLFLVWSQYFRNDRKNDWQSSAQPTATIASQKVITYSQQNENPPKSEVGQNKTVILEYDPSSLPCLEIIEASLKKTMINIQRKSMGEAARFSKPVLLITFCRFDGRVDDISQLNEEANQKLQATGGNCVWFFLAREGTSISFTDVLKQVYSGLHWNDSRKVTLAYEARFWYENNVQKIRDPAKLIESINQVVQLFNSQ